VIQILVVEDDEVTRKLLREVLEKEGYSVQLAASGEDAVRTFRKGRSFPIVISDIRMLELDGMAVLREAKRANRDTAVILMTGFGSMEGAIEAVQEGAFDYVSKPFKISDLKAVVARAAGEAGSGARRSSSRLEVKDRVLIGKSPRIVEVYKTLARAAMSSSTVLIYGESGTGKELVARAIHDNCERKTRRFVAVNCGGLAETELERVLTDAERGTLFLDEVCELDPKLQIRLLRALEECDVRVIAATHRDLDAMVRATRFREDLYYKLKVIAIELPPLRERMEDLPDLVGHFLARYAERSRKAVSHVSDDAMALLRRYPWPGNVRELEHAIERAVAMTRTTELYPEDLPTVILRAEHPAATAAASESAVSSTAPGSLEEMEKAHIVKVLQDVDFNKSRASEILGIDRATLYRKAQRYGIDLRGR
jgi:two-component system, NtrC family, response regulator AtoC